MLTLAPFGEIQDICLPGGLKDIVSVLQKGQSMSKDRESTRQERGLPVMYAIDFTRVM